MAAPAVPPFYGAPLYVVQAPCSPSGFMPPIPGNVGRCIYSSDTYAVPQPVVRKAAFGQHVVKYLKTSKFVDKLVKSYKIQICFNHLGNGDYELLLKSDKGTEAITPVEMELMKKVQGLHVMCVSMCHNYVVMLKNIKNGEILQRLKEVGAHAGWYANDFTAEVLICSDSHSSSEKALSGLYRLVIAHFKKVGKATTKINAEDYKVADHITLKVATIRYINAAPGLKDFLEREHDVKLECCIEEKVIRIFGETKKSVKRARADIDLRAKKLAYSAVMLTLELHTHLLLLPAWTVVQDLNQIGVLAGWQVENSELLVCSDQIANVNKAISVIMGRCLQQAGMCFTPTYFQPGLISGQILNVPCDVARVHIPMTEENLRFLKTSVDELQIALQAAIIIDVEHGYMEIYCFHRNLAVEAKKAVEEIVSGHACISYDRSQAFLACFHLQKTGRIVAALRGHGVRAGWSVRNGKLWLCSGSEKDVAKACDAVNEIVKECSFKVADLDLLKSEWFSNHFHQTTEELQGRMPSLVMKLDVSMSQVDIAAADQAFLPLAVEKLKELVSNACFESHIEVGDAEDLVGSNVDVITDILSLDMQEEINVCLENNLLSLTSTKSQMSANCAKDKVKRLLESLCTNNVDVEYPMGISLQEKDVLALVDLSAANHGTVGSIVTTSTAMQGHQMVDENGNLPTKMVKEKSVNTVRVAFKGLTASAVEASVQEYSANMRRLVDKLCFFSRLAALDLEKINSVARSYRVSICSDGDEVSLDGSNVDVDDFLAEFQRIIKASDAQQCVPDSHQHHRSRDPFIDVVNKKEFVFGKTLLHPKTDSEEHKMVVDLFFDTCKLSAVKILQVIKLQNDEFAEDYVKYLKANGDVEMYLWHGTANSKDLSSLSFTDQHFGRDKAPTGVYFSTSCQEALRYSSKLSAWEGYIVLVKVVTGDNAETVPRTAESSKGSVQPAGYLVYDMNAFLPMYLVKCSWRGKI